MAKIGEGTAAGMMRQGLRELRGPCTRNRMWRNQRTTVFGESNSGRSCRFEA